MATLTREELAQANAEAAVAEIHAVKALDSLFKSGDMAALRGQLVDIQNQTRAGFQIDSLLTSVLKVLDSAGELAANIVNAQPQEAPVPAPVVEASTE